MVLMSSRSGSGNSREKGKDAAEAEADTRGGEEGEADAATVAGRRRTTNRDARPIERGEVGKVISILL
jgi:hypothetical protein